MELENKQYCNVCLTESEGVEKVVFIQAICGGEHVHICTSCIPSVIHGSGEIVKSNQEVKDLIS